MINILNPDGTLNENAGPYKGLTIQQGPRRRSSPTWTRWACSDDVEDREIELPTRDR